MNRFLPALLVLSLLLFTSSRTFADDTSLRDSRLGPLKDLDGYFPFTPSQTNEEWETRAKAVRQQIRVALGIWPEPTRTPLNAVVYGKVERDDYTVEKVYFESMPGFFVTGSLYRPKGESATHGVSDGKHPGVVYAHGHWTNARFLVTPDAEVKRLLATGAEKFESGARNHLVAACVQLARAGCVVLQSDMLGNADSQQISLQVAHSFAVQRPEMNSPENWGLYSPQAESHAQNVMGLQIWNDIRALDFLCTLPDVDPQRLAMTGASGGGTQTMLVSAIDPRISVSVPAVMVSTAMQGGCTCENASLLRVGTGNVEFAALFAPKPMAMIAANDWTKEMPTKGFPELQRQWALLKAPDKVELDAYLQFPHNYNSVSRAAMMRWFNRYLGLGLDDAQLAERDFQLMTRDEMSVWDKDHPAPPEGPDFERKLLRWWHEDAQQQILSSPGEFEKIARPAFDCIVGRSSSGERTSFQQTTRATKDILKISGDVQNETHHESVSVTLLVPKPKTGDAGDDPEAKSPGSFKTLSEAAAPASLPSRDVVLWLDPQGKSSVFANEVQMEPVPEVRDLLQAGCTVIGLDLFEQSSFESAEQRRVKNPRQAAAYTFGYNDALFAQRVHDVLSVLHFVGETSPTPRISVIARGATGPIAAAARAVSGKAIYAAVIENGDFRFGAVTDCWARDFLPAAAKYGDLPGMLALAAPLRTYVMGASASPELAFRSYRADGAENALTISAKIDRTAGLDWLKETLRQPVTP